MFKAQRDPNRPADRPDSLYAPTRDGLAHGPYSGHVMKSSVYTSAKLSGLSRALPFIAAGVALAAGARRLRAGEGVS
jgi:hypothetical protein